MKHITSICTNVQIYKTIAEKVFGKSVQLCTLDEISAILVSSQVVRNTKIHKINKQKFFNSFRNRTVHVPTLAFLKKDFFKNILNKFLIRLTDGDFKKHIGAEYELTEIGLYAFNEMNKHDVLSVEVHSKEELRAVAKAVRESSEKEKIDIEKLVKYVDIARKKNARLKFKDFSILVDGNFNRYSEAMKYKCIFQEVNISEKNYKEALKVCDTNIDKLRVQRMYKFQNIGIYKDEQVGGRITSEYTLLPRKVRDVLFPNKLETDMENASMRLLYTVAETLRNHKNQFLYSRYIQGKYEYVKQIKEFKALKKQIKDKTKVRVEIGSMFDLNTGELNLPKLLEKYKHIFSNFDKETKKKLGKAVLAIVSHGGQLKTGSKLLESKGVVKELEKICKKHNINWKDLPEYIKLAYVNHIKKKINKYTIIPHLKQEIKKINGLIRQHKKFYKQYIQEYIVNIAILLQKFESKIMKELFSYVQEKYKEYIPVLIYDGIDFLNFRDKNSKKAQEITNDLNEKLFQLYFKYINEFIPEYVSVKTINLSFVPVMSFEF